MEIKVWAEHQSAAPPNTSFSVTPLQRPESGRIVNEIKLVIPSFSCLKFQRKSQCSINLGNMESKLGEVRTLQEILTTVGFFFFISFALKRKPVWAEKTSKIWTTQPGGKTWVSPCASWVSWDGLPYWILGLIILLGLNGDRQTLLELLLVTTANERNCKYLLLVSKYRFTHHFTS